MEDIPPIQVVEYQGKIFTIDNRRLSAFIAGGVKDAPVEVVSLEEVKVAERFFERLKPIYDESQLIVVATRVQRAEAELLLERNGMINNAKRFRP